ncbi:MAG: 3-hydroxybutyryl-CoA dehydrogenase [Lachnospiraceae bacterium]|nr:3-hydroxybutyryl-CoA dehydrogenase [Lachnospiraceae bacterium]
MAIKTVMVIGAGQMGGGIAQVFAQTGVKVYLNDIKQEFIDSRMSFIEKVLTKDVEKGKKTEDEKKAALANLLSAVDRKAVAGECDLVVEAAVENMVIKGKLFEELDALCKPKCILATNTSSLPITEIAAHTKRPDKVIGMHFMNPVPVMKLVEIIRGLATSDETYMAVEQAAKDLGKTPVEVRDVPGFISNRVLEIMINEAIYCLYEGVASVEDIDAVMKLGMNHPMGPLQLADFIGLDTVLAIMEVMYEGYGDCKYRPCPLLRQYVKAGWLGKKSGKGFYTYDHT